MSLKRGDKKKLWQIIATKLSKDFFLWFVTDKVRRKWQGLVESYKKRFITLGD